MIASIAVLVALAVIALSRQEVSGDDGSDLQISAAVEVYHAAGGNKPGNVISQDIMARNPRVQITQWSPLQMEGRRGNTSLLLAFAGRTGPDIFYNEFSSLRKNVSQGFCIPLNEFIGDDLDGNGQIDPHEAKWPYWNQLPEISRFCATVDGKVYGIPYEAPIIQGIAYRRDLFRRAGLPDKPPKDWDEFWFYCKKLTDAGRKVPGARLARGQRGFAIPVSGWRWLQWLWAAGGEPLMQGKTNPRTGKIHWFTEYETKFIDPQTGESLALFPSDWRATVAREPGQRLLEFFHKLCWQKWIRHPSTGESIDVMPGDVAKGSVVDPATGELVHFEPGQVTVGATRIALGEEVAFSEMFRLGEVAMVMCELHQLQGREVPPENLGFFAIPPIDESQKPVVSFHDHFLSMGPELGGPDKKAHREIAWQVMSRIGGPEGRTLSQRHKAEQGYARFMTPTQLRTAGLEEYIDQIPPHWRSRYEEVLSNYHAEPFMGYWTPVESQIRHKVLDLLTRDPEFDYIAALKRVEEGANAGIMFGLPEQTLRRYRPWVYSGVATGGLFFIIGMIVVIRRYMAPGQAQEGTVQGVHARLVPWLMLAPAVLLIILWQYYPLARGTVMAFEDYRIVGPTSWVGVDNFVNVLVNRDFYIFCARTVKYVVLSLGLTFVTPIILAILLSEVPRDKTFWRTIYFLPQISSGLVILFIWKLLYNPTEYGLLNQILLAMNHLALPIAFLIKIILLAGYGITLAVLARIGFGRDHETTSRAVWTTTLSLGLLGYLVAQVVTWCLPETAGGGGFIWPFTAEVFSWCLVLKMMFASDREGLRPVRWLAALTFGALFAQQLTIRSASGVWLSAALPLGGIVGQLLALVVMPVIAAIRLGDGLVSGRRRMLMWLVGGLLVLRFGYASFDHGFHLAVMQVIQVVGMWLIQPFNFEAQNWLGSTRWAMIAVILPGMWQGAGMGSLIYLAALKTVDDASYEAAEIDGAGIWHKLCHITIPYLKPLIIINFIGAFISTFQTMENIFAMTGGGPGDETMVLSLAIWYEAFTFLRFGIATSMAWIMGVVLIGFTLYQLRILRRVEFRAAGD